MRAAFRNRGFGRLFVGLLASMIGDSLMVIVLAVWVKELTGSNTAAGMTFFFLVLPTLFAPVLGLFIDRVRRRPLLIWGNLVSAVAVVPLLLVDGREDVWIIYTVAVLYGISFVALPAALNGMLKLMLPEEQLVDANASLSTSKEALRLVGPLLGAGLFTALGGGAVAMIDAASFVIAAAVIATLPVRESAPQPTAEHWRREFSAGIRFVRSDPGLVHPLIALGIALLVVGFMESAVFSMTDAFDKPASYVGVIVSVQGVGAIAGGLASSAVVRRLDEAASIAVSLVILATGLLLCAAAPWLPLVFVGVVVLGFSLPVLVVAFNTLLQRRTPQALMGRVSTAAEVVLGTPQTLSIAVGALLVALIGYREIYVICAAVILAAAAYLGLTLRSVSDVGEDDVDAGERVSGISGGSDVSRTTG